MRLVVIQGPQSGLTYELREGENVAGREEGNHVHLASRRVSRRHCVFEVRGAQCVIRDLGSANGVVVEGYRVADAELAHGSRIQVGDFLLQLDAPEQAQQAAIFNQPTGTGPEVVQNFSPPAGGDPFGGDMGGQAAGGPPPMGDFGGGFGAEPSGFGGGTGSFGGGETPFGGGGGENPFGGGGTGSFGGGENPFGGAPGGDGFGGGFGGQGFAGGDLPANAHQEPAPAEPSNPLLKRLAPALAMARQTPWPARLGGLLALAGLFILLAPLGSLRAIVGSANEAIENVALQRGVALAEAVGHRNAVYLAEGQRLKIDVSVLSGKEGVKRVMITDSRGTVLAPPEKANHSFSANPIYTQAVQDRRPVWGELDDEPYFGVMAPIRAQTIDGGPIAIVGYAYVVYDVAGVADDAGRPGLRSLLALIIVGIAMTGIFAGVWRLAVVPVGQLREDTELAIQGHLSQVSGKLKWKQHEELAHSINRVFARSKPAPAAQADDPRLQMLVTASPFPAIVLSGDGRVLQINDAALYVLALSREAAEGRGILEVVTDPAISDKISLMLQAIGSGQSPIYADTAIVGGEERRITVAGEPSGAGNIKYAVVVIA